MIPEGTKKFTFVVELEGVGINEQEAWLDATEAFDQDPSVAKNRRVKNEEQDSDQIVDSLLTTGVWENPNSPLFKQGCNLEHTTEKK